jgi:exopolysaccharide biosynthesis protein
VHRRTCTASHGEGGELILKRVTGFVVAAVLLAACSTASQDSIKTASRSGANHSYRSIVSKSHLKISVAPWQSDPSGVHIAEFQGRAYQLRIVLADNAINGGLQTTSSMCKQTPHCVVAVNGDFFAYGQPVGGVVRDCSLLQTPDIPHEQVYLDDRKVATGLVWNGSLQLPDGQTTQLAAVNQSLPPTGLNLYTPAYGSATPQASNLDDYIFSTQPHVDTTEEGAKARLTLRNIQAGGGLTMSGDEVVISDDRNSEFSQLHVGETLHLEMNWLGGCDVIGGHPILLNNGQIVSPAPNDTVMFEPDARTALAWTANGSGLLVTVDGGNNGSSGATAPQLANYLKSLGATEAINLDGGGSTTFVTNGNVVNIPSDGSERPVSMALVLVHN